MLNAHRAQPTHSRQQRPSMSFQGCANADYPNTAVAADRPGAGRSAQRVAIAVGARLTSAWSATWCDERTAPLGMSIVTAGRASTSR